MRNDDQIDESYRERELSSFDLYNVVYAAGKYYKNSEFGSTVQHLPTRSLPLMALQDNLLIETTF